MILAAAFAGFVTSAGLIIAIGAQNAFVLRQGLQRKHIGVVIAASSLGDIVLIACGIAGVGVLVREWPALMQVLRFGGAAFLGVYGLKAAFRAWQGAGNLASARSGLAGRRQALLASLAFTFLNPHAYLDTMVLLGGLSTRYLGVGQWAFGLGACAASIVWFSTLGYGSRWLRPVFANPKAWRVLDAVIAVFMLALCLLLLVQPLA
ncbi:LysE/ArgO family amino acid transporter [Castellaniella hirudinis]|uniref:LysE/ArgO family amino acid transporter n=1 Tax=Castellaniella hirudinis TaxID=1144617 RepID=UPI0039C002AC